jgi:cytoskeletal protein CcmA (bactofilin family)
MFSKAKPKNQAEEKPRALVVEASRSEPAAKEKDSQSKRMSPIRSGGVPSIISSDVILKGNINAAGEIQLDGTLEGDVKAAMLIVGERAAVRGEIICESVTVRGRVEGSIRAKTVSLAATSHVMGDILHSSLSVEAGAHFEGNARHSDDPLSEAASRDFRKARPTSGAPAPRPIVTSHDDDGHGPSSSKAPAAAETPSFLSQARSPLR